MAEKTPDEVQVVGKPGTPETSSVQDNGSLADDSQARPQTTGIQVPLSYKIVSILLVSGIGFGSSWSNGVTGAMKTTLKKVRRVEPKRTGTGWPLIPKLATQDQ